MRSFGRELPERVGDMGLEPGQGMAWLVAAEPNDFDEPRRPCAARRMRRNPCARTAA